MKPAPISASKLLRSSLLPRDANNLQQQKNARTFPVTDFLVPWHVSISGNCKDIVEQFNGSHYCGGVIIHTNYILSAAHCFYGDGEFRPIDGPTYDFLHECTFEVSAGGIYLDQEFEQVKH